MAQVSNTIDPKPKVKYALRFASSNQLVYLTQHQLDRIPYLSTLLAHKDDFSSIKNENGEYVINPPLEYSSFLAILRSITSRNPYKLFGELSSDENVFDTVQLFDYLGIESFPLPLLRGKHLVQSKSVNNEDLIHSVEYREATLPEARRTAAEFVLALAKNEYKLCDSNTIYYIFNLINIILFNAEVFSFRFRHHTLTIAKKLCYSFFSENQQRRLETSYRLPQYKKINSDKFRNTFSWRGVYMSIKEYNTKVFLERASSEEMFSAIPNQHRYISSQCNVLHRESNAINFEILSVDIQLFPFENINLEYDLVEELLANNTLSFPFEDINREYYLLAEEIPLTNDDREVLTAKLKRDRRRAEAQLVRSQRFNKIPKRSNVDQFKHRCGPKAQKYR